jgi:membrane protease YdiL (CAAX protease family)
MTIVALDRPVVLRSFAGRHPVASFLVVAYAIFWLCWTPVLFLGASPRLFSALGALLGLAVPAFLVTAAAEGRAGVRDLLKRTLHWRVGIGWYLLAALAIPVGALLLAPLFLGSAPLEALVRNWPVLLTHFLPQLLLAVLTVQFFEELGWAGFVQHRLQARHGALTASLLIAGVTHASFNEASELLGPSVPGSLGQVLAFASTALLAVVVAVVSKGRLGRS